MRIAKPLLIIITPIGVASGLYEAHRFGNWLMFLMIGLLAFLSIGMGTVIHTIRREKANDGTAEEKRRQD